MLDFTLSNGQMGGLRPNLVNCLFMTCIKRVGKVLDKILVTLIIF